MLLSHRPDDWRVLLGAYLLPPLVGTALRYGVVGPLLRRHRLQQVCPLTPLPAVMCGTETTPSLCKWQRHVAGWSSAAEEPGAEALGWCEDY